METVRTRLVLGKLAALRTELVDLAYELECRGRLEAADVAMTTSARVDELCAELEASSADRAATLVQWPQ